LIPFVAENYRVYAIDLLGFGDSDKPTNVEYGPELWADLVCDFSEEFTKEGAVLFGNSIGSLTVLAAAAKAGSDLFKGIVLLNCAGAMNRKGLAQDGLALQLVGPIFAVVEYLLKKRKIANFLFNR
jgi:pimeloyl-ACP methyl ester carboxylesterase